MSVISLPQLRRFWAFARTFTGSRAASRDVLLAFLRDFGAGRAATTEFDLLCELHARLRARPGTPGPEDEDFAACGMAEFAQLTAHQRAATFLVLGLDYGFGDAAQILGRSVQRVQLEVLSALLPLEHVLARRAAPAGRLELWSQNLTPAEGRGGAVGKHADVRTIVRPLRERPDYGPSAEHVCA